MAGWSWRRGEAAVAPQAGRELRCVPLLCCPFSPLHPLSFRLAPCPLPTGAGPVVAVYVRSAVGQAVWRRRQPHPLAQRLAPQRPGGGCVGQGRGGRGGGGLLRRCPTQSPSSDSYAQLQHQPCALPMRLRFKTSSSAPPPRRFLRRRRHPEAAVPPGHLPRLPGLGRARIPAGVCRRRRHRGGWVREGMGKQEAPAQPCRRARATLSSFPLPPPSPPLTRPLLTTCVGAPPSSWPATHQTTCTSRRWAGDAWVGLKGRAAAQVRVAASAAGARTQHLCQLSSDHMFPVPSTICPDRRARRGPQHVGQVGAGRGKGGKLAACRGHSGAAPVLILLFLLPTRPHPPNQLTPTNPHPHPTPHQARGGHQQPPRLHMGRQQARLRRRRRRRQRPRRHLPPLHRLRPCLCRRLPGPRTAPVRLCLQGGWEVGGGALSSCTRPPPRASCTSKHPPLPCPVPPPPLLQYEGKYSASQPGPTYVYPSTQFEDDLAFAVGGWPGQQRGKCGGVAALNLPPDGAPTPDLALTSSAPSPPLPLPHRPPGCTAPPGSPRTWRPPAPTSSARRWGGGRGVAREAGGEGRGSHAVLRAQTHPPPPPAPPPPPPPPPPPRSTPATTL